MLAEHFANKPRQSLLAPESLVPAEPISRPEKLGADADDLNWATYFDELAAWHRWRADLERWRQEHDRRYAAMDERQAELEDRMESVEEVTPLIPEILDRLGPETLSTEHQATVKQMAKRLNELSGISYATIYGELNAAFHVPRYADIPAHIPHGRLVPYIHFGGNSR